MPQNKIYDIIIGGSGLSGLSLAYYLTKDPSQKNLKILIIDPEPKNSNDRTWSFWTKEQHEFKHLITHSWSKLRFASDNFEQSFESHPYTYDMIRSKDFYGFVVKKLKENKQVEFLYQPITHVDESASEVEVQTINDTYKGQYFFKSYLDKDTQFNSHFIWQHFKGWWIHSEDHKFDIDEAVFMDFRTPQNGETAFFYVLPYTENKALVEIAILGKDIPTSDYYDQYIKAYLSEKLNIINYTIEEIELGAIPMTGHNFNANRTKRIIPIGTFGGAVKASSGYAFTRIQKQTKAIANAIAAGQIDMYKSKSNRYNFYDRILLNAIVTGKTEGRIVFEKLFKKLPVQRILSFLDEEDQFLNDLKIFTAPPTLPFIKAFFEEIKAKRV